MPARKKDNDIYLWCSIIAIGFYFFTRHEWAELAVYLPIIFFVLAWFFLLVIPTQCRYPTRRNGPCRLRSYGIIFGCPRWHFWLKARARLGIGERETPPPPAPRRRRGTGVPREDVPIPVRIEETRNGRISRRLGVLSACLGIVTSAGTIVTWVEAAAKWIISILIISFL